MGEEKKKRKINEARASNLYGITITLKSKY